MGQTAVRFLPFLFQGGLQGGQTFNPASLRPFDDAQDRQAPAVAWKGYGEARRLQGMTPTPALLRIYIEQTLNRVAFRAKSISAAKSGRRGSNRALIKEGLIRLTFPKSGWSVEFMGMLIRQIRDVP
ncbi:MAG: hypothetical protein O7C75_19060 [Verrucomicrobia bacterium]|nr:hypothetical protein [Verrucomicrobiota bacterium]